MLIQIGQVSGAAPWFGFDADGPANGAYSAKAVLLRAGADEGAQVYLRAGLPHPLAIDQAFVVSGALTPPMMSTARWEELRRRLSTLEVKWSTTDAGFLRLPHGLGQVNGEFAGDVRIDLTNPAQVTAALAARARLTTTIAGQTTERSVAFVLLIDAAIPRLRLDFDDFNLSLPAIDFPNLDLLNGCDLPFGNLTGPFQGLAGVFDRLASAIGKTVTVALTRTSPHPPKLKIDVAGNELTWRVADGDSEELATFNVAISVSGAGQIASIAGLSATGTGAEATITGTVAAPASLPFPPGARSLGPLALAWNGFTLAPVADAAIPTLSEVTLRARVSFERLMVYATEDPTAAIAFAGEIEFTPSGTRVIELRLVEPYPVDLIQKAAGLVSDLSRRAASVIELAFKLDPDGGAAPGFAATLDALGRIAAAIGRASAIAAGAAKEPLHTVAEALGRLLASLAKLAGGATQTLAVEIRISTDPLELRQILLTARNGGTGPVTLSALGLRLDVHQGFEPGLLIDFVAEPGAYLIVSGLAPAAGGASRKLATLSTDLWLATKTDGPSRAIRDADAKDGERGSNSDGSAQTPLIALEISTIESNAQDLVVVIAGLQRGRGTFFQRVRNVGRTRILGAGGAELVTSDGPFAFTPLAGADFTVKFAFEENRILPLLGMGEPGKETTKSETPDGPNFLRKLQGSLSQTVWVKGTTTQVAADLRSATVSLALGVKAAGVETEVVLDLQIDLNTLEAKLDANAGPIALNSRRIEERALGLVWVIEQRAKDARDADASVKMFELSFEDGETAFELNRNEARMEIRFADLSSDGKGVALEVKTFRISRAGLDLRAEATGAATVLNGVNTPFRFTTGAFEIRSGRLVQATIGGRGSLPRDLVGEVDCSVLLDFRQDPGTNEIVLQKGKVDFDKRGEPIKCHATRFTLTIDDLDIAVVRDGGYHFYFVVSGAIEFTPGAGEFEDGLLKYLKDVRIDLEQFPLTGDARTLAKHISFQKAFNPKKTINLFNLFEFELRGFGFHPSAEKFGGDPAINISGQIKFAEIGDVMKPSFDFHGLWIAPPKGGNPLPRVRCDGLGIEIGLSGAARIRGTALAVDPKTDWLEFGGMPPAGYDAYGFLGEGELSIEGWGSMSASMGFLEVAPKERPDDRKKAFFLYLQQNQLSVEIPVVVWKFNMREVGFGFGYRYTLAGIKAAEDAPSTAKLIAALDDVSKRQGDLARFAAWTPDPEGDKLTLAMRALFQCYPAPKNWNLRREMTAEEPFLFDIVAALRSDMTFLMSARGWVATNYYDFLSDSDGSKLRNNPGLRGYLFISAPRQELLLRAIGSSGGYVGDRLGDMKELGEALKSVDWSMTLYINPKLFHLELGWSTELVARLKKDPDFTVTVRGGLIFRVAEDGLLWGFNIEADAFIVFKGGFDGGSIGVMVEASLTAKFVARLICFISWRLKGTLIYGLISLDANLEFRVRAWMEIDLGIRTITLRISFSRSVQFSAAVEMALSTEGVGARVQARIAVSTFGCTLSVGLGFVIGGDKLEEARARVRRFLALGIASEPTPDPANVTAVAAGDAQIGTDAAQEKRVAAAERPAGTEPKDGQKPSIRRADLEGARPIRETDFWLVLRRGGREDPETIYALLVPRAPRVDKDGDTLSGFYAAANGARDANEHRTTSDAHAFEFTGALEVDGAINGVERWLTEISNFGSFNPATPAVAVWDRTVPAEDENGRRVEALKLAHLFDECFLYDSDWVTAGNEAVRVTKRWTEPPMKYFGRADLPPSGGEQSRRRRRDEVQRDRLVAVAETPFSAACHDARSTVLATFLDQFVAFAAAQDRGPATDAHVTDLGLVFRGDADAFQLLEDGLRVKSCLGLDGDGQPKFSAAGSVTIFNPPKTWFQNADPVLAFTKTPVVEADGVKLDWRLEFFLDWDGGPPNDERGDPEQYLSHYEILCELGGDSRWDEPRRVKPCATEGGIQQGRCTTLAPDWQFADDLADLPEALRLAILPRTGDEQALDAASAWVEAFGEAASVAFTYSIIPVDVAGTRGSERTFVVEAPRPQAPIRPAKAELRFAVQAGDQAAVLRSGDRPNNLSVTIAIEDSSWQNDAPKPLGSGRFAHRLYRLIVDPEEVVASGSYGSDGMTDREAGLRASGRAGDEVAFIFWRGDFDREKKCGYKDASAIEPDAEARQAFRHWLRFAGVPSVGNFPANALLERAFKEDDEDVVLGDQQGVFFETLWRRNGEDGATRAAARFHLETLIVVSTSESKMPTADEIRRAFVSRRVPIEFEIAIEPPKRDEPGEPLEVTLLRPAAFEWPVRLDLPPLGPGEVRAVTGFALFRAPAATATLSAVIEADGVETLRDPERRILTMVEWDAWPLWAIDKTNVAPDPIHASTIGGFDLHELDIDDLAPLDNTGPQTDFAKDAGLWSRARRVARAQLIPASAAMLTPHGTQDLLGWQAHYPSETWRAAHDAPASGAKPVRRGFWSSREATLRFPDRPLRLRLLPLPDDNVPSALMRRGAPAAVYARVVDPKGSVFHPGLIRMDAFSNTHERTRLSEAFRIGGGAGNWVGWTRFDKADLQYFTPGNLRALQLCLARPSSAPAGTEGLVLKLAGAATAAQGDARSTGEIDIPLDFASPLHPIIEETIAELALEAQSEAVVYRRYRPVIQPPPQATPVDAADLFAKTQAAADPYGWGALQTLGLAATIRLFDGDLDVFVDPETLLRRVDLVMKGVVARYREYYESLEASEGHKVSLRLGAPFVDVLLRPGRDRVAGAFDAVDVERGRLDLKNHGLAMVQISLRPRPAPVWRYHRLTACWARDRLDGDTDAPEGGRPKAILFSAEPRQEGEVELFRPADARFVRLGLTSDEASSVAVMLPSTSQPTRKGAELDPALTLVFRSRGIEKECLEAGVKLKRVLVKEETDVDDGGRKKLIEKEEFKDIDQRHWLRHPGSTPDDKGWRFEEITWPGAMQKVSGAIDPFERFAPKDAAAWVAAFAEDERAKDAYDSFRVSVRAAYPDIRNLDTLSKSDVALYLDWSQRFLDHGLAPEEVSTEELHGLGHGEASTEKLNVALAAPSSATPWRLAAESDGTMSLSFLHADRWAHARAYAVKPFGRYQELMIGSYAYRTDFGADRGSARAELERLLPGWRPGHQITDPMGYAVAVSPRTEKIEPPLILASGLWRPEDERDPAWRLVVSRHAEEALSASNRSVFGKLGWEGVALSFARDYRDPEWPDRLAAAKAADKGEGDWAVVTHPIKKPTLQAVPGPNDEPAITDTDLRALAMELPTLWKGADVYRFPRLPHHYRLTALAVARAGIVVSPITVKSQSEFAVAELAPERLSPGEGDTSPANGAALVRRDGGFTRLVVSWRLFSYADLMGEATRNDWVGADLDDVAHWPDPDVVYAFERRREREAGETVEEDAEIRLVARAPENVKTTEQSQPIVLRARGTRFVAPSVEKATVARSPVGSFVLSVPIALAGREGAPNGATMAPLCVVGVNSLTEDDIAAFNSMAQWTPQDGSSRAFAALRLICRLELRFEPPDGTTRDAIVAEAGKLATAVDAAAAMLGNEGAWKAHLDRISASIRAWAGALSDPPPSPARLFYEIEEYWPNASVSPLGVGDAQWSALSFQAKAPDATTRGPVLTIYDLPSDDEFRALDDVASSHPGLETVMAQLRAATRDLLSGGAPTLTLRAVHGRAGPKGTAGSASIELNWPA